jgi:hypothetical protein
MKLDKYGNPLPEEKPVPLIKNLVFNDGENYIINNVEVVATNITSQYIALEDSTVIPSDIPIPDGFILDRQALQENRLEVMLTDKIFNYLTNPFGGNLIRLDFVVTHAELKSFDSSLFTWSSLFYNDSAICVSKSIDNALRDINVVPMSRDRKIIHTVFIKTEAY